MSHTYTHLLTHIVFGTWDRAPLVTSQFRDGLYQYMGGIVRAARGVPLIINGMPDHVHMLISIPPKYSVSHIVGFLKGKTALYITNKYARKRRYKGYHFWARGYFVSAAGYDEQVVRRYIRDQEKADKASDFADLFNRSY